MTMSYRIGIAVLLLAVSIAGGFFCGQSAGRQAALKRAVTAFQARETINHDVQNMDGSDLCIALGGLRDECADIMRGVAEAAESQ